MAHKKNMSLPNKTSKYRHRCKLRCWHCRQDTEITQLGVSSGCSGCVCMCVCVCVVCQEQCWWLGPPAAGGTSAISPSQTEAVCHCRSSPVLSVYMSFCCLIFGPPHFTNCARGCDCSGYSCELCESYRNVLLGQNGTNCQSNTASQRLFPNTPRTNSAWTEWMMVWHERT